MRKLLTLTAAAAFALVFGFAGTASALTNISIDNDSFEDPTRTDGQFTTNNIPDWDLATLSNGAPAGVFNPTSSHVTGGTVPDGSNVAYSNGRSICQTLGDTVQAETTYTLTVKVGRRLDTNFPGYDVFLRAGGTTLASKDEATGGTPAAGDFLTVTVIFDSPSAGAPVGDTLEICLDSDKTQTLFDEVGLTADPFGFSVDVAKGNVMGPYDDLGALDASASFDVASGGTVDGVVTVNQSGPDAGGIWIGLDETQRYKFEITIVNSGGSVAANGAVIIDVIPAEYDLDPGLHEDDVEDGGINGLCDGGTATCDGDALPGFVSSNGACVVEHSQPDSASKPEPPPKQPEFLTIMLDGLGNGESCTVTVYVKTDNNPGGGESPDFEPTSCRLIAAAAEHDDVDADIFDTITLNEGLKVFDPSNGERVSGPEGSLQLTCNIP